MSHKKATDSSATIEKGTLLMQQHARIKAAHPHALLLFRVGDFYEAFGQDAVTLSQSTGIALTQRSNGSAPNVALAGFPYHALDTYIPKLVRKGIRVAICEQLEEANKKKGLVKRGITELITPGLAYHDHVLDQKQNNYLASLHFGKKKLGLSLLDLSTGEFMLAEGEDSSIEKLIESFTPSEVIFNRQEKKKLSTLFPDLYYHTLEDWVYQFPYGYERLNRHFATKNLKGFGIEELSEGITAAGAILYYLEENKYHHLLHISSIARLEASSHMWIDKFTIRNLELLTPQQEGGVPLIEIIDHTVTPMGARMLKRWLLLPLKELTSIEKRLKVVSRLVTDSTLTSHLLTHLKEVGDLERLIAKVAAKRVNPRELMMLKKALSQIISIKSRLKESQHDLLLQIAKQLDPCTPLLEKIEKSLYLYPPLSPSHGNLIRPGINATLDELRKVAYAGQEYLEALLKKAKEATGISSLKMGSNKIFGYYLEVRNTHKTRIPPHWIRKQTLVNAERYITEELKSYEEKIVYAKEKACLLEYEIFRKLVEDSQSFVIQIQHDAKILAMLDCYRSFAELAIKNNYAPPRLNEESTILLKEARHPVIERHLPLGTHYVPNDISLDSDEQQILLVTGPNMGGKSAILRQVLLTVLLAHIGSFVPASLAIIGIVDKIFSRVGSSDNLAQGESTFMVEMNETASILNNLSTRSLIALDELGRGTGTADGLAIAQSVIEYLHNHPKYKAKTLFATHYHELNILTEKLPKVKNFHVAVKESNDTILFLHQLQPGGTPHSFGVQVAKMAGIPKEVIARASEILDYFRDDEKKSLTEQIQKVPASSYQLTLLQEKDQYREVIHQLKELNVNSLTPVEALVTISKLVALLER